MSSLRPVGLFGGTFDPVHIGHLRVALELSRLLQLAEMRLIPCAEPPHRNAPLSSGRDRLAMLQLAVAQVAELSVDDCELRRQGASYSMDTLAAVRGQIGDGAPLFLCVGMDSLVNLAGWHRWRELREYANIVVAARPGWTPPQQGPVAEWLAEFRVRDIQRLRDAVAGMVYIAEMTLLPVSSTAVRQELQQGLSAAYLVPDAVLDYIKAHRLYKIGGDRR